MSNGVCCFWDGVPMVTCIAEVTYSIVTTTSDIAYAASSGDLTLDITGSEAKAIGLVLKGEKKGGGWANCLIVINHLTEKWNPLERGKICNIKNMWYTLYNKVFIEKKSERMYSPVFLITANDPFHCDWISMCKRQCYTHPGLRFLNGAQSLVLRP